MKSNGIVIYQGPSLLDRKPIVVIVVGLNRSENKKTGAMVQTYIMRSDVDPITAIQTGNDSSICGACPHRGIATGTATIGRTCYVNVGQGPNKVYDAYKRGIYPVVSDMAEIEAIGAGRNVRLGTYGDPGAVPAFLWRALVSKSVGHTGYTHQWRTNPQLQNLCMASADSESAARAAHAEGWRTFRVALPSDAPKIASEVSCPASAEAGKKLNCDTCLACNGANGRRGSIVIQAHGGYAVMANIKKRSDLNLGGYQNV